MATQPRTYAYVDVITYVRRHPRQRLRITARRRGTVFIRLGRRRYDENGSDTSDLAIVLSIRCAGSCRYAIDRPPLPQAQRGRTRSNVDRCLDRLTSGAQARRCPFISAGALPWDFLAGSATASGSKGTTARTSMQFPGSFGVGDPFPAEGDVATVTDAADLNIFGDGTAHALVVVVVVHGLRTCAFSMRMAARGGKICEGRNSPADSARVRF